jgi:hypothetical protein
MIHADLQHHAHILEDRFTSNCLGLLRLLPDSDFIDFFSYAVKRDRTCIDLSRYRQVSKLEFWRWLLSVGIPDVIGELQHSDRSAPLTLIIEAKLGAPKSGTTGTADTAETSENPGSSQGDPPFGDQLAKYWQAACKHFPRPAVIYLTHHRSLPETDFKKSLCEAGADAGIFWLSWLLSIAGQTINSTSLGHARPLKCEF